jgi:hypothetical protein
LACRSHPSKRNATATTTTSTTTTLDDNLDNNNLNQQQQYRLSCLSTGAFLRRVKTGPWAAISFITVSSNKISLLKVIGNSKHNSKTSSKQQNIK